MIFYITGINGFIGSQLAYRLIRERSDCKVVGIYHSADHGSAIAKHLKLLEHWRKFLPEIECSNFIPLSWDEFDPSNCDSEEFTVIHAAASTNFDDSIEFARAANLTATLKLLNKLRFSQNLRRFIHISTAFVSACESGLVDERRVPKDFNNTYEQSKYESEIAVRHSGLPYTIFRPSIVVGDSKSGYSKHFRVFYSMFRLWLTGVIPRAPIDQEARADVVPIDFVVDSILGMMHETQTLSEIVNLTSGPTAPKVREIFESGLKAFGEKPARFSSPLMLKVLTHPLIMPLLNHSLAEVLRTLAGHFPYFGSRRRVFSTRRYDELNAGRIERKDFSEYGFSIFNYALVTRWGKISHMIRSRQ